MHTGEQSSELATANLEEEQKEEVKRLNGARAHQKNHSDEGYQAFHDMHIRTDDIIFLSFPKCGTTWVHRILTSLARLDDEGKLTCDEAADPALEHQYYPEWLHHEPGQGSMGAVTIDMLQAQPSPRIFPSHLRGDMLPPQLAERGKLMLVLRHPKDAYTSLHFMRGEAKDGWVGNEHGPGSFHRYLDQDATHFGGYFTYIAHTQAIIDQLGERALVLYYEDLKTSFDAQLTRIADFLSIPLSPAKRAAVIHRTSFHTMKNSENKSRHLLRKGTTGDWANYVDSETPAGPTPTSEQWAVFDARMQELAKVASMFARYVDTDIDA